MSPVSDADICSLGSDLADQFPDRVKNRVSAHGQDEHRGKHRRDILQPSVSERVLPVGPLPVIKRRDHGDDRSDHVRKAIETVEHDSPG